MRVAVYSVVSGGRCDLTSKSFKMLRTWAGEPFDHYVAVNGADDETVAMLRGKEDGGYFRNIVYHEHNYGQNIAANWLLDEMDVNGPYDWVLRWDDDALPRTRRFLRKLVLGAEKAVKHDVAAVWSPRITKLENEPPGLAAPGDDLGFSYEPVDILGGICRLHPWRFFEGWRFNRFGSLGFGEAIEAVERARGLGLLRIRNLDIEVEHAYGHRGQIKRFPERFTWEGRVVGRYLGYGLV